MPIDSITVRGIRGIRAPITLQVGGRSLLLHGANGCGKSSVERALRWALMGEEVPTGEEPFTTESSYRRHVEVAADYPAVTVTFVGGGKIEVTRAGETLEGDTAGIRTACQRGVPFLRRRELLDVLAARPSDRFRYFESFLGLDPVDEAARGVADQKATLERRTSGLRRRIDDQLGALRPLLPEALQASAQNLTSLEKQAVQAAVGLGIVGDQANWDEAHEAVSGLAGEETEEDLVARRTGLNEVAEMFTALRQGLADPPGDPAAAEAERRRLEATSILAGQFDLIRHALRHFEASEGEQCPVCGQDVDWAATRESLRARSVALDAYAEVIRQRDALTNSWLGIWRDFRGGQSRLERLLGEDRGGLASLGEVPGGLLLLDQHPDHTQEREVAMLALGGPALGAYLNVAVPTARDRAIEAARQVPGAAQLPGLRLTVSLFERLAAQRLQLQLLVAELATLERESTILGTIHESLRRARQDVARETLNAISARVRDYYAVIHPPGLPDESTAAPEIVVQRHGGGTAFVRGQFAAREVRDPQWVYSDGHLDTVGICIFLALRRFRAQLEEDPRLLVLDDIIVSIDLGHARRLIDLLVEEFADHQIFLFTHNGLFAHWCADLMPGLRRLEIKAWTLEEGPRIGEYVQARDRLVEGLATDSAKEIGLKLMWLMDEWLGEARYAYSLSVPARPDERYTLTDIWNPFAKIIRRLAGRLGSDLGGAAPSVEQLGDLPSIRNSLPAHDNDFAREFPRAVMVEVAEAAVALVDGLYCRTCRTFARPVPNRDNPEVIVCRCRSLQYVAPSGSASENGPEA